MNVETRQMIEREIIAALAQAAISRGYSVAIDNGEELKPRTKSLEVVMGQVMETDTETMVAYNDELTAMGWFDLVYGNDGWDVVADHSTDKFAEEAMLEAEPVISKWERLYV